MTPVNDIKNSALTNLEKDQLKHRIRKTIVQLNSKRKRWIYITYAAAASVVALPFIRNYYFNSSTDPLLIKFIENSKDIDVNKANNIVLVLSDNQNINVDEGSGEISYSSTGEKINLGQSETLNQNINNEQISYNTLLVPYGKRTQLNLSDGSIVWLNSGSKLIYPANFKGNTRELYLEGEAVFDVAHNPDRPFVVRLSKDDTIEVLGTVFNISSYPEDDLIQTTLKSGSIKIKYSNNNSPKHLKIAPNTLAEFDKKQATITSRSVDVTPYFSWKEGIFIFKNDNLETIFKKISRYYNVKIEFKNNSFKLKTNNETFTGYLQLRDGISEVLNTVIETTNFNYTIEGNTIHIN